MQGSAPLAHERSALAGGRPGARRRRHRGSPRSAMSTSGTVVRLLCAYPAVVASSERIGDLRQRRSAPRAPRLPCIVPGARVSDGRGRKCPSAGAAIALATALHLPPLPSVRTGARRDAGCVRLAVDTSEVVPRKLAVVVIAEMFREASVAVAARPRLRRGEGPCIPRSAVPVRWAVRGEVRPRVEAGSLRPTEGRPHHGGPQLIRRGGCLSSCPKDLGAATPPG